MNRTDRLSRDVKIISRYVLGEKIIPIAESYKINQHTVRRVLRLNNVPITDRSQMLSCKEGCGTKVAANSHARSIVCPDCKATRRNRMRKETLRYKEPISNTRKEYKRSDPLDGIFGDALLIPQISDYPRLMKILNLKNT